MNRTLFILMLVGVLLAVMTARLAAADEHAHHDHAEQPKKPVIFGWSNPTGVWFQLNNLSNAELLLVDRNTTNKQYIPVWQAILIRPGMQHEKVHEAVAALMKLKETDRTTVLVEAIDKAAGEDGAEGVVAHLTGMLAGQKPEALGKHREKFAELIESPSVAVQRAAYVGLIAAGAESDELWQQAETTTAGVTPLLEALPMLGDDKARAGFAEHVAPLLDESTEEATLRAAMLAAASMPGRESETFRTLAKFVENDTARVAAIRAMLRIDVKHWPKDVAPALAKTVVSAAAQTPVADRTSDEFVDLMSLGQRLTALLPPTQATPVKQTLDALGVRIVRLKAVYEEMRYDVRFFAVKAGQPVQIVLENPDVMPHNIVVTSPGSLEEVGLAAEKMSPPNDPSQKAYIPDLPSVLHSSHLVQAGETGRLSFTAPDKPGEYPYVCTFPGHWTKMYGVMIVTNDLDAWLASPTKPKDPRTGQPFVELVDNWTLEKLRPALKDYATGRDFERGRFIFKDAGCFRCHKVKNEGNAVGPELTDVFQRLKGDREKLLTEILDPSQTVAEEYQQYLVDNAEGTFVGLITKEDDSHVWLVMNPNNPVPQKIEKDAFFEKRKTKGSMMPKGLINYYHPPDIMDLLAYIEAGGDSKHKLFAK